MRKILVIVFLNLFIFNPSKGDDIRDFEIEGMSIGDSLLDYFSRDKILKSYVYPNKKYASHFGRGENFKIYEGFQAFYLSNDDKYIIHYLSGIYLYKNNINECYEKMYFIAEEIKTGLSFEKYHDSGKMKHTNLPKSFAHNLTFSFKDGGNIVIACMDFHKDLKRYVDKLAVSVRSKEFVNFLSSGEAYK